MSSGAGPIYPLAVSPAEAPAEHRSYFAEVARDAVAPRSAKLALAWIACVAEMAVLAPLIANSNPCLINMDGHWSSPLLRSLNWTDLALLIVAVVGGALGCVRRKKFWPNMTLLAACLIVMSVVYGFFGPPPQNVVYEQYRDAMRQGRVQFVLHAPIPYSPSDRFRDEPDTRLLPPSRHHLLGTEAFGADVLSRMIHACRIILAMGFVASGIAVIIGVVVGGLMGYFSGIVDILGMRLIEIFEAIPTLFLMITLVAFFPSEDYRLLMLMVIIGITGWTGYARFTRAEYLSLRSRDFVQAAQAAGLPLHSVLFRHMLPNGITPVVINLSFGIAAAIIAESTLSFLQLGVIDQPSWGAMLSQATGQGGDFLWWMALFPGLAIFLTVFAYVLLGESVNDALDPRRRR